MLGHAFLLLAGTSCAILFGLPLYWLVLITLMSIFLLYYRHAQQAGHWQFVYYPANVVTIFRFLLLCGLLVIGHRLPDLALAGLALLVLLADGLDGYLARKYDTTSNFGAYLDMETDAFYVLSLSLLLATTQRLGYWIIGIGLLRYLYFPLIYFLKPPARGEGRRFGAQLIAVILMGSLIAGWVLPEMIYRPAIVIAALLVLYSFATDFISVIGLKKQQQ